MSDIPPINTIVHGDALSVLQTLPDNYVQCVVTSPPYFNLRSYLPDGHPDKHLEIGLEETPEEYVEKLVSVFHEVRRVLRPDGICWINLGDSFADKNLLMIPARAAIALCSDGWYLRQDCIWHKSTAMPESVTDRPTTAHEHLFLLAKSEQYFYDAQAIREPAKEWAGLAGTFARPSGKNTLLSIPGQTYVSHRSDREDRVPAGRNKRSVWTIANQPYSEAHFATMPPKLVEPCILAGTSPMACNHCSTPWHQLIETVGGTWEKRKEAGTPTRYGLQSSKGTPSNRMGSSQSRTAGWKPSCTCSNNTGSGKCIVLDPFIGSGTVSMVALQHNRNYLGIELNSDYIALAQKRIAVIQPNLWSSTMESDGVA